MTEVCLQRPGDVPAVCKRVAASVSEYRYHLGFSDLIKSLRILDGRRHRPGSSSEKTTDLPGATSAPRACPTRIHTCPRVSPDYGSSGRPPVRVTNLRQSDLGNSQDLKPDDR